MAKHRGRRVARVTRICARSGITTHQRLSHSPLDAAHACRVSNGTSPTAIAHGLEFSIPVCKRHPYFNLDIRIARWFQRGGYSKECWKLFEDRILLRCHLALRG